MQSYHSSLCYIKGQKQSPRGCFVLRNLIQFAGKDLCRSLCNFTGEDLQLYFKRDSSTGVFLWILGNFWERLFLQNTSIACFWKGVLIFRQRAQRERERERERDHSMVEEVEETILLMFRIIPMNASLVYLEDVFLRSWIIRIVSGSAQAFLQLWEVAVHGFSGISKKKYSRKTARWSLGLLMLQRGVFRTQSNNHHVAFLRK